MVELYNDQLLDLFDKSHAAKLDIKKDKKGAFIRSYCSSTYLHSARTCIL